MARLMIFVQHPRHVSTEEAESWLAEELEPLVGNGVERVELKRLRNASLGFGGVDVRARVSRRGSRL